MCDRTDIHEKLTDLLFGELPEDAANEVRAHLESCDDCRSLHDELKVALGVTQELFATPPDAPTSLSESRLNEIMQEARELEAERVAEKGPDPVQAPASQPRPFKIDRQVIVLAAACVVVALLLLGMLLSRDDGDREEIADGRDGQDGSRKTHVQQDEHDKKQIVPETKDVPPVAPRIVEKPKEPLLPPEPETKVPEETIVKAPEGEPPEKKPEEVVLLPKETQKPEEPEEPKKPEVVVTKPEKKEPQEPEAPEVVQNFVLIHSAPQAKDYFDSRDLAGPKTTISRGWNRTTGITLSVDAGRKEIQKMLAAATKTEFGFIVDKRPKYKLKLRMPAESGDQVVAMGKTLSALVPMGQVKAGRRSLEAYGSLEQLRNVHRLARLASEPEMWMLALDPAMEEELGYMKKGKEKDEKSKREYRRRRRDNEETVAREMARRRTALSADAIEEQLAQTELPAGFSVKNTSFTRILAKLEKHAKFEFAEVAGLGKAKLTLHAEKQNLGQCVQLLAKSLDLRYQIVKGGIIFKTGPHPDKGFTAVYRLNERVYKKLGLSEEPSVDELRDALVEHRFELGERSKIALDGKSRFLAIHGQPKKIKELSGLIKHKMGK